MKKTFLILLATMTFTALTAVNVLAATIIIDNNPSHVADYRTLQEAVDGASAGDTILIGPSFTGNSYGNAEITKKLYIYGTGYLLSENGYTGGIASRVGNITFTGELLGSSSSGSIIAGVEGGPIAVTKSDEGNYVLSDILITRNKVSSVLVTSYSQASSKVINITVSNNLLNDGYISVVDAIVLINNNIISYRNYNGFSCSSGEIIFTNNSMKTAKVWFADKCSGESYNNIWNEYIKDASSQVNVHDNYADTDAFLEASVYTTTGSEDAKYQLKSDSLAKGACLNEADCGAFAGATPYTLSGLPPRPRITNLELPASVLSTDATMQVKISAESHN